MIKTARKPTVLRGSNSTQPKEQPPTSDLEEAQKLSRKSISQNLAMLSQIRDIITNVFSGLLILWAELYPKRDKNALV